MKTAQNPLGTVLDNVPVMRCWVYLTFSVLQAVGSVGCSSQRNWVECHGGLDSGAVEARVQAIGRPLLCLCDDQRLSLHILNSTDLSAYSWPTGEIYLTRGLVDESTDPQVAAAVAHELGHLLNDGHLARPSALRGCDATLDQEAAADQTGIELLRRAKIDGGAMKQMLEKVASRAEPRCRPQLLDRAALLGEPHH